ncbi:MAG: redox-regulated ATPase YchF [Gemmatimonadetes bacterium]|jgi:ribosome-binding ATPase|nr:redox-regulated ATPase YchF [Gemmatimonadota bacterium]
MLKVGIVGLPNVGKSSLFNAITAAGAPSENYPFCTVEPNVGTVEVPDVRLDKIFELAASKRRLPSIIQFVDIAGLVEGASEGEGLGNKFLGNIREVDAIAHVLRCFDDPDVTHVIGGVDPVRDREIVETELALADLDTVQRRLDKVEKKAKSGEKESIREKAVLDKALEALAAGKPVRSVVLNAEEAPILKGFQLLTSKPVLYVANVGEADLPEAENDWTRALRAAVAADGAAAQEDEAVVTVCSALESELAEMEPADRQDFLEEIGVKESGLNRLIRGAYELLGLVTFFTVGPQESRAWTVRVGSSAPQAAGTIHSDFERGFIRAETIHVDEFEKVGSWKAARDVGVLRSEGKTYTVVDGDIMLFRFNV